MRNMQYASMQYPNFVLVLDKDLKCFKQFFFQFTHGRPDIHRLQPVHMAETHFLLENLWIS